LYETVEKVILTSVYVCWAAEELGEDKVGKTLQTMGRLSTKVRSRVYRAVVHQMQGLKQQSEQSVGQVTQMLEMVRPFLIFKRPGY